MPILRDIAAIAKGMSITFREMFQPTIVENYPDGPGPLKGAKFQERPTKAPCHPNDAGHFDSCRCPFLRQ